MQNLGDMIPNTTFNSINSFSWIGNWEGLDPKAVAALDLKSRYPFLHYVELFTATGGCTAGFKDRYNTSCEPWMDVDAPRSANLTYSWSRLLRAIDNVLAAGFVPYVVTGNVPVSLSTDAIIGGFGVNTQLPRDLAEYSRYIQSFAQAALTRYGAATLRQWKWGVLTEVT